MPYDESDLLAVNRAQCVSEVDDFTEERYTQFFRHLPRDTVSLLDVGCNTGRGGAVLRRFGPTLRIDGLDCVPERLESIPSEIYNRRICSFSDCVAADACTYDAIVAGEFIEHVPPERIYSTLCECFRLLKLRGRLLLTTPNPRYLKNWFCKLSVLLDPSHVTQHYPGNLRRRLMDVGFSRVVLLGSGRMTRKIGENFPMLSLYGSYLIHATKW